MEPQNAIRTIGKPSQLFVCFVYFVVDKTKYLLKGYKIFASQIEIW